MAEPLTVTDPQARAALARADVRLASSPRMSLDPTRAHARGFVELADALEVAGGGAGHARAFAEGCDALADAIVGAFPDNLFWDLDALLAHLAAWPTVEMEAGFDDLVTLHARFGRATAIRFRYVHDFLYGYDWTKWVRRDPTTRADVHPYDRAFFGAMLTRGEELIALIARGDAKYHRLEEGRDRNPFGFSREPADEARLCRALAARGQIPVEAWRLHPRVRWDHDYYAERRRTAQALGLTTSGSAPPTTTAARE